jgi:hypothetical protein
MSKCLNELDFNEIVKQTIQEECESFIDSFAYSEGMRFDDVGEISGNDRRICKQAFKGEFNVDQFLETLSNNMDFRDKIEEYVENL